jgi:electron transfer flavoprotein-quinone oxidoreductase
MRFDVVVVGAGPAGAAAAYAAASGGLKVLLVERGRGAGSKQVYGGKVYSHYLEEALGDLKGAPIERWVGKERLSIVDDAGRTATLEYEGGSTRAFTAHLTKLAAWLVDRAASAGAVFVDEVRVDSLRRDPSGRFSGVEAGGELVEADVIIDAEGVNRLLLERAGLVERASTRDLALGVKEVVRIGEKEVEERFGLDKGEGLSWILVGGVTGGLPGGAFVYTNKDTVSLGLVLYVDAAARAIEEPVHSMIEKLRTHPALHRYWADGDVVEYAAKLTPESGYRYMPRRLVADGLMVAGDAAGMLLNLGYTFRGVDYAVYSGYMAGRAAIAARDRGGPTEENLRELYEEPLRRSRPFRDLWRLRGVERAMEGGDRYFRRYPALMGAALRSMFELGESTPSIYEALRGAAEESGISIIGALVDALMMARSI